MEHYVTPKEACKILGVHQLSLKNWEVSGKIECIKTPGGKRLYNVSKYLEKQLPKIEKVRKNICYCRVSTRNQKDDLERQINYMKEKYPNHAIMSDIGSGLNMNRKKLREIINMAINGEINEVIVAHRDRLARFGYELIESIVNEHSNGKIIVINKKEMSPEEEITKDLLSIITVFSARVNGLRKYKTQLVDENKIKVTNTETDKIELL
jgi:predicted site-specific integrase-resolvase